MAEFRIGQCVLHPYRQLLADGRAVTLPRKPLALLSVLAEADGSLVTKDELMTALWPGIIVEENALQAHVVTARKALGSDAACLETVRGLGYRLLAQPLGERTTALVRAEESQTPLLAVLALECGDNASELSHIAESLSEEILHCVGQILGLSVFGRASSFALTENDRHPSRVAALLGATHVLDGAVKTGADGARLSIELSETRKGIQIWSGRFDADARALPELARVLARAVANGLQLPIAEAPMHPEVHPVAFDHYLRGRQLAGPQSTRSACIRAFEAAIEIDPNYAAAWSSLALARALKARWDVRERPFSEQKAEVIAAAERALTLDPNSGPAQVALGILEPWARYAAREQRIHAAVQAAPEDAEALRQQAEFAYCTGRITEAAALAARTHGLDPLNPLVVQNYASLLSESGRAQESYLQFGLARARWPNIPWFCSDPIIFASFLGDWQIVDQLLPLAESRDGLIGMAVNTARALRDPTREARAAAVERAHRSLEKRGRVDVSTLTFLCGLGLTEEAFNLINLSNYEHLWRDDGLGHDLVGVIPGIIFGVTNRPMRRDPRFVGLCTKLGLSAYWAETGKWPDCALELNGVYDFRSTVMASFN